MLQPKDHNMNCYSRKNPQFSGYIRQPISGTNTHGKYFLLPISFQSSAQHRAMTKARNSYIKHLVVAATEHNKTGFINKQLQYTAVTVIAQSGS
jgi:hypothetical protein